MARPGKKASKKKGRNVSERADGAEPIREWEVDAPMEMQQVFDAFKSLGDTGKELKALRVARKDMNEAIKTKQGHLDELLEESQTMRRKMKVKVREVPEADEKRVAIVRIDNDEIVTYRPMSGGELQALGTPSPAGVAHALHEVAKRGSKSENDDAYTFTGDEPAPNVIPNPDVVESLKGALQQSN